MHWKMLILSQKVFCLVKDSANAVGWLYRSHIGSLGHGCTLNHVIMHLMNLMNEHGHMTTNFPEFTMPGDCVNALMLYMSVRGPK